MSSGKPQYRHPELQKGEVFLGNFTLENYALVGWKTKRLGVVAYDRQDRELDQTNMPDEWQMFPVFAQRAELQAEGIDPDNLTW